MPRPASSLQSLYHVPSLDDWVADAAVPSGGTPSEKLVRCLWFDPRWRPPRLRTLAGQEIVVHSPGRWNLQAGPDFLHAVVEFPGGEHRHGDVEVHCYASGWTAHRHHQDPRYARVILHVCLWNDRQAPEVLRSDGRLVPQVALAPFLPRPLALYQTEIPLEDYPAKHVPLPGYCYQVLQALPSEEIQQFLARAGDLRLHQRVWRWQQRATEVELLQVMYEAVLRALGATAYRQPFQALACLVPWRELQRCLHAVAARDRERAAEALLLGLAGLLPPEVPAGADAETRQYLEALWQLWATFPPAVQQRAWQQGNWRRPHGRPTNTPERRLAAMAQLLARYHDTDLLTVSLGHCRAAAGEGEEAAGRTTCRALTAMLSFPTPSYWSCRVRLGGRRGKPLRLLGPQRALTVVIDAVVPVLLLHARRVGDMTLHSLLLSSYRAAPPLPDNHLLRYMRRRLLGDDPRLLPLIRGARQQQGLLQIYHDFCGNDEGDCQGCNFPLGTPH